MQKQDYLTRTTVYPAITVADSALQANCRLVVLVSNSEMDAPAVARRIVEIAQAYRCSILFLGLCSDKVQEASLRRQLIALSAMVRAEAISFESKTEIGKDWLNLVRANFQEGDIFICFRRQKAGMRGSMHHSLLEADFSTTVYLLDDTSPSERPETKWKSTVLAWTGSILIILAFFWLQIWISQSPSRLAGMVALILSLPIEAWLILAWNSLLG